MPAHDKAIVGVEAESEWRRGWKMLVSSTIGGGVGYGLFQLTAGMFIIPMQKEFGWSRGVVAIAPVITMMVALMLPLIGVIISRVGARRVALIGLLMMMLAYGLLSIVPRNLYIFYATIVYVAIAGAMAGPVVFTRGILTWFRRNAGGALGITMSGLSIVSAPLIPPLALIIEAYGWRAGYAALAVLVAVVGLPLLYFWFREKAVQEKVTSVAAPPAPLNAASGSVAWYALRTRQFWVLAASFGAAGLPIGGFMSQLQPIMTNFNQSLTSAAALVSVYIISMGVGRIIAGFLLDRFAYQRVAALCFLFAACGAGMLAWNGVELPWTAAAIAVVLLGLSQGAEGDFVAYFTVRVFGLDTFAIIFAMLATVGGVTIAAGGILFAVSFDIFGSYQVAAYGSVVSFLVAALMILTVNKHEGTSERPVLPAPLKAPG
ncbi:MFS transporter [Sphingobium mellinum]|uniref:MFS transporter n=1 Tax=Sphingobium mellinum TaxID=1387166 RepID=UPI0030EEF5B8